MPVVISVSSAFVILGFKSDVITPCCEQLCAKVVIESLLYETARKSYMLNARFNAEPFSCKETKVLGVLQNVFCLC